MQAQDVRHGFQESESQEPQKSLSEGDNSQTRVISPDWRCWSCVRLCFPGVTGGFAVAELWGISYRFDCALLPQPGWAQSCLFSMALMACSASLCSPVDFLNSTVSFSLPRFIRAALPVRCLSRWIIPWSPWANLWKRVCWPLPRFHVP